MRRTIVVVVVVLGWNVDPIRSSTGLAGLAVESGSSGLTSWKWWGIERMRANLSMKHKVMDGMAGWVVC